MESHIADQIEALFGIRIPVTLTQPDAQFGDYATNVAMQLAKPLQRSPRDIAQELAESLQKSMLFQAVTVAGPGFINIRVAASELARQLNREWSEAYGENRDGVGKRVIVEYPSPNMAKPYSVGHLRPGNQGWAVKRLMQATGWTVITDNHLGDYGAPFGIWVVGFLMFSNDEKLAADGVYELGRIYIHTKAALAEEKERGEHKMADDVQDWLVRLENGDAEAVRYSKLFNGISLDHIHAVMKRLHISTDYELGEAFFAPRGKEAVARLEAEGIAQRNEDGSVIIPLEEFGFDVPLLVQKRNGTALYATTDLATLIYREDEFHPDRVIYAVGAEQQFYFSQLFALAKKLGVHTELIHLWFGTIDQVDEHGVRAKMSSRKGVVLMEELLDTAEDKARELVAGRRVSEEDIQIIALGAVKFTDFVADRRTNILFNWTNIFALSGFSGPYIQYAAVRVHKLLHDAGTTAHFVESYTFEPEKPLLLKLLAYPSVVRLAARDLEPHKIATYLYELARELNRYYEHTRVVDADEQQKPARIWLLQKVAHTLVHGLDLLGIAVPDKM